MSSDYNSVEWLLEGIGQLGKRLNMLNRQATILNEGHHSLSTAPNDDVMKKVVQMQYDQLRFIMSDMANCMENLDKSILERQSALVPASFPGTESTQSSGVIFEHRVTTPGMNIDENNENNRAGINNEAVGNVTTATERIIKQEVVDDSPPNSQNPLGESNSSRSRDGGSDNSNVDKRRSVRLENKNSQSMDGSQNRALDDVSSKSKKSGSRSSDQYRHKHTPNKKSKSGMARLYPTLSSTDDSDDFESTPKKDATSKKDMRMSTQVIPKNVVQVKLPATQPAKASNLKRSKGLGQRSEFRSSQSKSSVNSQLSTVQNLLNNTSF